MFLKSNSLVRGALIGALLATVLVTLLTVVGELVSPLKNFLKDAHHHHWVGKGIWAGILFVATALIMHAATRKNSEMITLNGAIRWLSWILVLTSVILFVFFIYEYGVHH